MYNFYVRLFVTAGLTSILSYIGFMVNEDNDSPIAVDITIGIILAVSVITAIFSLYRLIWLV